MKKLLDKVKALRPIYDTVYNVLLTLCKLLLIGDVLITIWAVA